MNEHKLRKRIKKLRALVERGVGGEADNARRLLDELLKEHQMELEDFGEQVRTWEMTTLNEGSSILEKVIKSVCPEAVITVKQYKSRLLIEVPLSEIHYQEIKQKNLFFWRAYNEERKYFLSAFFNRHAEYFIPLRKDKPKENPNPTGADGKDKPPPPPPPPPPPLQDVPDTPVDPMTMWERKRVSIIMSALRWLKYDKALRANPDRMIDNNKKDEHKR
jgi:hypothetical protein